MSNVCKGNKNLLLFSYIMLKHEYKDGTAKKNQLRDGKQKNPSIDLTYRSDCSDILDDDSIEYKKSSMVKWSRFDNNIKGKKNSRLKILPNF